MTANIICPSKTIDQPVLAAPVTDLTSDEVLDHALQGGLDVAELRVDKMTSYAAGAVQAELQRLSPFVKLVTARAAFEGGEWRATEQDRLAMFLAAMPELDVLDIELAAVDIRDEVIHAAQQHNKIIIGSHHNFVETPSLSVLESVIAEGQAAGVDVVKVACTANSPQDLQRLAELLLKYQHEPSCNLIIIGMGEWGLSSRIFFPALGSRLTFTHLGEASAPGQLALEDMLSNIQGYYPAG